MDPRIVLAPTAPDRDGRSALVALARRRGFCRFALRPDEADLGRSDEEVLAYDGRSIAPASGRPASVPVEPVDGPEALGPLLGSAGARGVLAIRWAADRLIPTENAVAARKGRFHLWVVTDRPRDVPGALGALEAGADRVVVEVASPSALDALVGLLEPVPSVALAWELVPIRRVAPAGLGDRVIVDTTSILDPAEGLLVGSSAGFLFHVPSEAEGSRFTRPRPFRVNAGSAHSYVLLADGTTRYLSELAPGDAVLVARPGDAGRPRAARVGRLKVERRPMVLVEVERASRRYTVFLQEAETVRLSGGSGRRATTDLAPEEAVYGVALPPARHLGEAVEESIEER